MSAGGNGYYVRAGAIDPQLKTGMKKKHLNSLNKTGVRIPNQMMTTTDRGDRHVSERNHRGGSYRNEHDDCQLNSKTMLWKPLFR